MRWVVAVLVSLLAAAGQAAPDVNGNWEGKLSVQGMELRIVLVFETLDGKLRCTLFSPDQTEQAVPVSVTTVEGSKVHLEVKSIAATFDGEVAEDGKTLKGSLQQLGANMPLELAKVGKLSEPNRPQTPKPPFPYRSEEATYRNEAADVTFGGTLTIPPGGGPHPAVVMISGSGSQDRDETLFAHKPFWVIADHLSRHGIAVLRVDDRGVGKSTRGKTPNVTTEDYLGDVLAALAYLKTRPEIDKARLGLIGHSEGGLVAPMVAAKSADVVAIVLLAAPGLSGETVMRAQRHDIGLASGLTPVQVQNSDALFVQIMQQLKDEPDNAKVTQKAKELVAAARANGTLTDKVTDEEMDTQMAILTSAWFRFFSFYDPAPALRKVACSVLALTGEKDLQVRAKENLPAIEQALKDGRNADYTLQALPGLNHLFQHCKTGSPSEYGQIEETFAPEALQLIGDWLGERFGVQ
ncbi:MAG: alpha/beta hydrolase [Armatimonadetes bacterium]|nr:alpha/beta hydrolase [Armatimonadota bacterium]